MSKFVLPGKQSEVSKADYEVLVEANRLAEGAVTVVELRQKKLEWNGPIWRLRKPRTSKSSPNTNTSPRRPSWTAAELAIKRRVIMAPFDGIVERLARKQEEWVNPGDTILQLLRLDTMEVEGAVDRFKYDPHELQGCEVTVEVELARGRKETVPRSPHQSQRRRRRRQEISACGRKSPTVRNTARGCCATASCPR